MPSLIRVSLRDNLIRQIRIRSTTAGVGRKGRSCLTPWRALSLQFLDLAGNKITCFEGVDGSVCPALVSLTIDNNLVSRVSLKRQLPKLRTLRMRQNPFFGPFNLALFPSLHVLDLDACELAVAKCAASAAQPAIPGTSGDGVRLLRNAHKSKLEQLSLRAQSCRGGEAAGEAAAARSRLTPLGELEPLLCSTLTKLYLSGNEGADSALAQMLFRRQHSHRGHVGANLPLGPAAGPAAVLRMETLVVLELCGVGLDDARLRDLFCPAPPQPSCFPKLRALNLSFNPRLRDLRALCARPGLPRLYRLVAIGCGVQDPSVVADLLAGCRYLRYINLRRNPVVKAEDEDNDEVEEKVNCRAGEKEEEETEEEEEEDHGEAAGEGDGACGRRGRGGRGGTGGTRTKGTAALRDGPVPTTAHITGMKPYPGHGMMVAIA
ncbi:MAG: hypothetical protein BJ554DRAFT_7270 [Olpidium bornovanus]|uniref:Uncharacterized protein n=1 Tax=Olpidium bornovanus TaxID=278681 RepID=A0A8H8A1T3_9FUNG|nr:MAG: hypothetical protein BJ554DRAFT_7270 [Olpidium bornovanus]